ncbi:MAG: hypothetical protein EOP49_44605, partial [Sphingobacteriales bacterium]
MNPIRPRGQWSLISLLLLLCTLGSAAQPPSLPVDSMLRAIPGLMRTDEARARQRGDAASAISTMISIGWAYMESGKPLDAIRFFDEVLRQNPSPQYENRAVLM